MSTTLIEGALAAGVLVAGIIHLIPGIGLLSAARLKTLYGVELHDPKTILLLRHRAILFAILGTYFVTAALFQPGWRILAAVVALVCMLSFIALAREVRSPGIQRLARVDLVVSVLLAAALALRLLTA